FLPLRCRPVAVPPGAAFVVAHSLEDAAKSGGARGLYNQRVVECRLACAVLAERLQRPLEHLGELPSGDVLDLLPDVRSRAEVMEDARLTDAELARLVPATVTLADPDHFVLRRPVRHLLAA